MTNQNVPLTPKGFLKTLSIIHGALIAGLILFGFMTVLLKGRSQIHANNKSEAFVFVVPLLAAAGVIAGQIIFKSRLESLDTQSSLKEKLKAYQAATITRFALVEGPALFGIVAYLLNWNILFLIISGLLILYLLFLKPTRARTEMDLKFSYEEKLIFDMEEEVLK